MDKCKRTIDVLLFDGINILDVAGPVQAFKEARVNGESAYAVRFVSLPADNPGNRDAASVMPSQVTASCGLTLTAQCPATIADHHHDLLVAGGDGVNALLQHHALQELIRKRCPADASTGSPGSRARLISVCSGALLLASAGVLNGRKASTHWSREPEVLTLFPDVHWQLDRILVNDGPIHTSAGVTTGIDLALSLIRQDCGNQSALAVARELVMYLQRSGGQSQYAQLLEWQFSADDSLAGLLDSLMKYPNRDWTLEMMASAADTSSRTLTRRFTTSFNTSPMKFLEQLRVRIAGDLLSAGVKLERVAARSGFGDVQTLRRAFKRQLGITLGDYQRRFGERQH